MTKTIVIDPGHGGNEPGARAVDGQFEKAFNLELGLAVRAELQAYDVQVLMTREEDRSVAAPDADLGVELWTRAQVANRAKADLFVSLHHDSTGDPRARGGSLWIWTGKRNPRGGLAWLPALAGAVANHQAPKSYALAEVVQPIVAEDLAGLGVPWRGHIQCADFGVLRHTDGPAILIECFFGSSPDDVAAARQPEFVPRLARSIASALATALDLWTAPGWTLPVVKVVMPDGQEAWGELRDGQTWVKLPGTDSEIPIRPVAEAFGRRVRWENTPPTAFVE